MSVRLIKLIADYPLCRTVMGPAGNILEQELIGPSFHPPFFLVLLSFNFLIRHLMPHYSKYTVSNKVLFLNGECQIDTLAQPYVMATILLNELFACICYVRIYAHTHSYTIQYKCTYTFIHHNVNLGFRNSFWLICLKSLICLNTSS